jgi:DNA (cytosine-5)-methyltransferase 1
MAYYSMELCAGAGGQALGPTRARKAWASLGVDGKGIANDAPEKDFEGLPRLTVEMVA